MDTDNASDLQTIYVSHSTDTSSHEYNRHRALCNLYRTLNDESRQQEPDEDPVPAQVPAVSRDQPVGAEVREPLVARMPPETERPTETYIPLHDEDDDVIQPSANQTPPVFPDTCPERTTSTHEQ